MYRAAHTYLEKWKDKTGRKPLVIRGARQVGKSYLVRMFAEKAFKNFIEINLEVDREAASLFQSKDPRSILSLLEARYSQAVRPGQTLLFLDEIQSAPQLFADLRYFFEKLPALHIIAAGSLLDFALAEHDFSVPVGRIEYLHLGPMTFDEFLVAAGKKQLERFLSEYSLGQQIPESLHAELLRMLRQYLVVGGMPSSVAAFLRSGSYRDSEEERQAILSTCREDFGKYAKRVDHRRLEKVFLAVPRMAGMKFMYSRVDREERSRELSRALELLCMARIGYRVCHTSANGVPLGAEADDRNFKVLFLDVGLLCRSLGLSALDFERAEDLLMVNAGAVCEQFVGQHLLYAGELYSDPALFCWMRQKSQSNAEVDFIITSGSTVIPVEVKAGKTGTLRSLHVFLTEKKGQFAIRFNADGPSLLNGEARAAKGPSRPFRLLSLPLYMSGHALRLCTQALRA